MPASTSRANAPEITRVKTEVIDRKALAHLLANPHLLRKDDRRDDAKMLRQYQKARSEEIVVEYRLSKKGRDDEIGRLYPQKSLGLGALSRNVRAFLAGNLYWDIDCANSQPNLLRQMADQNNWRNDALTRYCRERKMWLTETMAMLGCDRETAKDRIIALFYGSKNTAGMPSFFADALVPELTALTRSIVKANPQILKKLGKESSVVAYVLATEEREVLLAMDSFLESKGRPLSVLIHDGGMLTRLPNETEFPPSLLRDCEAFVLEQTGYSVRLEVKPMETTIQISENTANASVVDAEVLVNDAYAAEQFRDWMGDHLVYDRGQLWCFDDTTGLWTNDEVFLDRAITKCGKNLVFIQTTEEGTKTFDYSGNTRLGEALKKKLYAVAHIQDDFFLNANTSSTYKFLFSNGYVDLVEGKFHETFDPSVVFYSAIPRPFRPDGRDADAEAFVRRVLFEDPFPNPKVGRAYLHYLARGVAGDWRAKKMLVCIGPTNTGKGVASGMLQSAFGSRSVGSFNGNSLLHRRDDYEATKGIQWVERILTKRIAFSNEMKFDPKNPKALDGNLIKSLASGGDPITYRTNGKDEKEVINTAMLVLYTNEFPPIAPVDDAIRNRIVAVPFYYSFLEDPDPNNPRHKKADKDLKDKLTQDPKYLDALVHILMDEVRDWLVNGRVDPELPPECVELRDEIAPVPNLTNILSTDYVITRNPEDSVPIRDLFAHIRNAGLEGSDTKLGRMLTDIGLEASDKRQKNDMKKWETLRVRTGIRAKGPADAEPDE